MRQRTNGTFFEGLNMKEQLLYQLLKILKHNGNVWDLINEGYEFGQVTHFVDELQTENYISTDAEGKTHITAIADAFILGFEANNGIRNYSKWILPRSEMWHKPIGLTSIYVPKE